MCLTPVTLKGNNSRDGYSTTVVPCGRCPLCRKRRINGWAFRLLQELKTAETAVFLTLTYDPETVPVSFNGLANLEKSDLQKFFKRLRKNWNIQGLKYYACGEYGENTRRPHYHAIIYNIPYKHLYNAGAALNEQGLQNIWKHGLIHIGTVTENSVYYTLKYLQKSKWEPFADYDDRNPEFQIMSKKIGANWLTEKNANWLKATKKPYITTVDGQKQTIPRYYKDKIFDKEEKRRLHKANPIPPVEISEREKAENIRHQLNQQKRKK